VAGAEIRRYSSDRRGLALNVFLGIAGSTLGSLAETLILPSIVLAYFVGLTSTSFAVVGLVPALAVALWSLARLPAAILVGPQRRKLPWAIGAALVRAAATALLAAVCFRAPRAAEPQPQLVRAFFVCFVAYALAAGFASVPTGAVLAKAIPQDGRELFFAQRNLWGGVAGLLAGLVVVQLLGEGPSFPRDYALLFLAATVCQLATAFFVATLREPIRVAAARPVPLASLVGGLPSVVADPNYRRFLAFRSLLSLSTLPDPFFVIFAVRVLAVDERAIGWYVVALVAGRLLSAPVWAAVVARSGERSALQLAALSRLVAPLVALVLPVLRETDLYRERIGDDLSALLFGVVFLAIGISLGGQARANQSYLAQIAPSARRPAYLAWTNAALVVLAFAPVVGGMVIERYDFEPLFMVATLVGLAAVFASGALTDTHVRTRRSAQAWRLRRPTSPVGAMRRR
jgi:MFS family permease